MVFPVKVMFMFATNAADDDDPFFGPRSASDDCLTMTGMEAVLWRRNEAVGAKLVLRSNTRKS